MRLFKERVDPARLLSNKAVLNFSENKTGEEFNSYAVAGKLWE